MTQLKFTLFTKKIVILAGFIIATGCNQQLQSQNKNGSALVENKIDLTKTTTPDVDVDRNINSKPNTDTSDSVTTKTAPAVKTNITSKVIQVAYSVMTNEGKKIGAYCNRYVERVLEVLGFRIGNGFMANDFAKKNFKNYKALFFNNKSELETPSLVLSRKNWFYYTVETSLSSWARGHY